MSHARAIFGIVSGLQAMNINTMRNIDYFVGIPLCFIVTFLMGVAHIFSGKIRRQPQQVLFIELSEMGSAILADPAMRKIQRTASANLYFLIFQSNAPSLFLLNTVPKDNIFTLRNDSFLNMTIDTLRFLRWARREQIDTVIDLELFSRFSALLTGLSGAVNRIGFHAFCNEGLYRGNLLTHKVAYNAHLHIAKNFVALVNAALANNPELPFSKQVVTDAEIQLARAEVDATAIIKMHQLIKNKYPSYDQQEHRIVLINPNASDLLPQRRWMEERFIEVMRDILTDNQILVLITGAANEHPAAEQLKQQVGNARCINFAGCVRLEELPTLYQIAEVMLTNDSGPNHFAAVTALRTLVIFGPETPHLYGSLGNSRPIYAGLACSPCVSAANHRKTPCTDNVCLQVITTEMVLTQLRNALRETANGIR